VFKGIRLIKVTSVFISAIVIKVTRFFKGVRLIKVINVISITNVIKVSYLAY
jgi:hypothetical protein